MNCLHTLVVNSRARVELFCAPISVRVLVVHFSSVNQHSSRSKVELQRVIEVPSRSKVKQQRLIIGRVFMLHAWRIVIFLGALAHKIKLSGRRLIAGATMIGTLRSMIGVRRLSFGRTPVLVLRCINPYSIFFVCKRNGHWQMYYVFGRSLSQEGPTLHHSNSHVKTTLISSQRHLPVASGLADKSLHRC